MIPKVIHYCWFGNSELSDMAKRCIESWKKYCPDYEIKCWNEKDFDLAAYPYMKEAYEEKKWGFVPDIARLLIIYNNGGIYLDTDVEICKSFDELLENEAFAGFEDKEHVNLGQGFGAEKNNQVILEMLKEYEGLHFRNIDNSLNTVPSPYIQTKTLLSLGLILNNKIQSLKHIKIYSSEYFCPISFRTGKCIITDKTFSIHHFDGSWLDDYQKTMVNKRREIYSNHSEALAYFIWQYTRLTCRIKKDGIKKIIKKVIGKHERNIISR